MTKNDKFLVAGILVCCLIGSLVLSPAGRKAGNETNNGSGTPLTAEISVSGNSVAKVDLSNPPAGHLINISGPLGTSVAEVKQGAIRMLSSPCPDKVCVNMGWINRPGQSVVCVPNRVIIRIISGKSPVDSIAG